jgi:LytR cell envelope-related transcriptional attenuator
VDAPLVSDQDLVRPWRRATIVASLVAAVELVLLVGAAMLLLAKPLARVLRGHAEARVDASATQAAQVLPATVAVGLPKLSRQETGVFVLNGNGRPGAAAAEAKRLSALGYVVPGTGNAPRQDYATTVIMFRPRYRAEAQRLARDLRAKAVAPLDGLSPGDLRGAHLAVVVGAA